MRTIYYGRFEHVENVFPSIFALRRKERKNAKHILDYGSRPGQQTNTEKCTPGAPMKDK